MIRHLAPLMGAASLIAIICWRTSLQFRRYGNSGIVLFRSENWRQNVRGGLAVVFFVLMAGQAVVAAFWPQLRSSLGADHPMRTVWEVAGAVLMFAGLVLLIAGQLDLGASWRIGIEEGASPGLRTSGMYRYSRNPIYLGMSAFAAGYTLVLPTGMSIVLLLGALFGVRLQTLDEEAYLLRTYGTAYREYAHRVGRFLAGIGRLR